MSADPLRAWFDSYIDAFNRDDFETVATYYADDIAFFGQAGTFSSRSQVIDFYRLVKSRVTETLEILSFVGRPGRLAVAARTTLVAKVDWPDFPTRPLVKGQARSSVNFLYYDFEDRRFTRIRSARYQGAA